MSDHDPTLPSRRDFLQLSWKLTAGLAVPATLVGCGGGDDGTGGPTETFVEPPTLASVNGRLDVTLNLGYLTTTLDGKTATLRNMGGSIPAPTLRINVGDTLRILVTNNLPPNPPSNEPTRHLRYHNSTNLHTHGLHVDPGILAPGLYGDYVMDDPEPRRAARPDPAVRVPHPPRPPGRHLLVSPAPARLVRDAGRQRHGGRAADRGPDRPGARDRRRLRARVRVPGADLRCDRHAQQLRAGGRQSDDRTQLPHQRRAPSAHPHEVRRSAELALHQRGDLEVPEPEPRRARAARLQPRRQSATRPQGRRGHFRRTTAPRCAKAWCSRRPTARTCW